MFAEAGLDARRERRCRSAVEVEPWLARAGCDGRGGGAVRELAADRIDGRLDHARRIGD
jgi:hypothetical protein